MSKSTKHLKKGILLLCITSILWITLLLFQFRIAGTIELKSELQINHPFVTIAGQTAPGGGICIKNAGITIITHDVLIQHIRVRPGNKGTVNADINDAVSILGPHAGTDGAYNIVLDHVSASWSEDETVSTWYGAHDVTISRSIISEALNRSRHRKQTHSAGLLIGDSSFNVSVHHNLLAHNDFRNPLIAEGGTHDFVNNVIYDWGILPTEIVDYGSNTFLNFVGNYYVAGPSTNPGPDKIVLGNNVHQDIAKHVFPVVDAGMLEHYSTKLLTKDQLLQDWAAMLRFAQAGKMSVFRIGVEQDPFRAKHENQQLGRDERVVTLAKERLEYHLACYLIGAQPYSYFQYGWGWDLEDGSLYDYPELHRPLGHPKGAYQRTTPDGWEFTREFEHASVWVNTETGQGKITWR